MDKDNLGTPWLSPALTLAEIRLCICPIVRSLAIEALNIDQDIRIHTAVEDEQGSSH